MTDRRLAGEINDVALLDLTPLRSAEELAGITRISDVAIILVPESLMAAAVGIPMDDVAMVVPVPDGVEVRVHTGSLVMGGEALAGPGVEHATLLVTGTLILTSPVHKVAYRQIIVMGLVLAPSGSESALGAGLTRVTGSVDYYPYAEGQEVRVSTGEVRADGELFANPTGGPDDSPRGGRPADRDRASCQGGVPAGRGRRPDARPPRQPARARARHRREGPARLVHRPAPLLRRQGTFGRSFFELADGR